jgi:hyperosmotically inducible protein
MKDKTPLRLAIVLALASAALAACDRPADRTAANRTDGATVGQKVDNAVDRTTAELTRAGEQIKPSLERAGDSIERAAQDVKPTLDRAGEKMKEAATSDGAITTSIKADYLKDPDLSVFKIDVDTKDGVVTLNGMADTAEAKSRAEKMAGAVKGVKEVRNRLTVKAG